MFVKYFKNDSNDLSQQIGALNKNVRYLQWAKVKSTKETIQSKRKPSEASETEKSIDIDFAVLRDTPKTSHRQKMIEQ